MMKISCTQCKTTLVEFPADDLCKHLYLDDGTYFFCNMGCKDKWDYLSLPEGEPYNPQQQLV